MHQLLHIAILVSTLLAAAALLLFVLWPLFADAPLARATKVILVVLVALGALSLLIEWRLVH